MHSDNRKQNISWKTEMQQTGIVCDRTAKHNDALIVDVWSADFPSWT